MVVLCCQPGAIVWDLSNGKIVADLKGHKYGVSCLAFSPKPRPGAAAGPPLLVGAARPF